MSSMASITVASECSEAVCERKDHISSEGIVSYLLMDVLVVRHRKVLGLAEDIICSQGKGELVLEEKLGDLGIDDDLIFLRSGIPVIPVVVGISYDVHSSGDSPVH